MRFKKGQQVVCVATGKWIFTRKKMSFWKRLVTRLKHGFGPDFNEIVTCDGYSTGDLSYMFLAEYRRQSWDGSEYSFNEDCFEPIMPDDVLRKELESIKQQA